MLNLRTVAIVAQYGAAVIVALESRSASSRTTSWTSRTLALHGSQILHATLRAPSTPDASDSRV